MKRLIPSSLVSALAAACALATLGGCVAYPAGGAPGYGYSGGYYDDSYGQPPPYGGVPAYGYAEPPPVQSSLFLGFGGGGSDYNRGYWGRGYDHGNHGNGNWNGNRGPGGGGPHGPPPNGGAGGPPMQPGGNSGVGHGNRPPVQAGGGQSQGQPQGQPQGGGNRGGGGGRYVSPGEARNAGGGTLH